MTIQEKLKSYKDKINNVKEFNNEFKNLVGIELFDFIHSSDLLKTEFERRRDYLKNLADDASFNSIQDNLFETIQKILKLTSLKEVQERQKVWGNALFNRLKHSIKKEERVPDVLTLPEIYVALQDKNNYYRLKDNSYFSPFDGEISLVNHIVPVKKQYEVIVENFFREIFLNKPIGNEKKNSQFKDLINQYNDYWYKFDELIYRIPVKLHFKSFENFFSDCTEFCIREGYEFHYNFFANSNSRNTEARLIKVKKDAMIVIDDLIESTDFPEEKSLARGYRNQEEPQAVNREKIKAHTLVKDGMGYFKFYKEGSNIKIGKENTRQFKLLRCLTEPNFGIQKTIEAVFEAIKQPQDGTDSRLSGLASPQRKTRMLELIDYTKKELQKIKELQGKINYCMDDNKQNMWLK